MPRAIVFDLWFTLITPEDFLVPYVPESRRVAEALELEPQAFSTYWTQCSSEMQRTPKPVHEHLSDYAVRQGRTLTAQDLTLLDRAWECHDRALMEPRPDVLEPLRQLAEDGYRLGVLSNAHEREVRAWSTSPFAEIFDAACFSCHVGYAKPEAEAYRAVLDRLGVPGSDAVFVGDGWGGELSAARAAGMRWAIWMRGFCDAWNLDEEITQAYLQEADAAIARIGELATAVAELRRR